MGCRDIRESISACVDGEASPGEAASVREHLASCERCRVLERQMRAVGAGVRQVRGSVPDRFREEVFARLESEGALPKRKKVFPAAWRWAPSRWPWPPGWGCSSSPRGRRSGNRFLPPSGNASALSTEDREMLALLDILEDPADFDANDDAEEVELLAPGDSADSPKPPPGRKGGA